MLIYFPSIHYYWEPICICLWLVDKASGLELI